MFDLFESAKQTRFLRKYFERKGFIYSWIFEQILSVINPKYKHLYVSFEERQRFSLYRHSSSHITFFRLFVGCKHLSDVWASVESLNQLNVYVKSNIQFIFSLHSGYSRTDRMNFQSHSFIEIFFSLVSKGLLNVLKYLQLIS